MNNFEKWRGKLVSLCNQALTGRLSLEKFYAEWPEDLNENSGFSPILYEDLEDGIQHFPGHLFSGRPDFESWKKSHMYMLLYLDKQLLLAGIAGKELIEARMRVGQERELTQEKIESMLRAAGIVPSIS